MAKSNSFMGIGPATPDAVAAAVYDNLESEILNALGGYTALRYMTGHGVDLGGYERFGVYRFPDLDRYHSDATLFAMTTLSNDTAVDRIRSPLIFDADLQNQAWATIAATTGSFGQFTTWTSWPNGSAPQVIASAFNYNQPQDWGGFVAILGTLLDMWTLVSEHGVAFGFTQSGDSYLYGSERPLDTTAQKRHIGVEGRIALDGSWPITLNAPTGSAHVQFLCEGVVFNVTFPSGVPLYPWDICREISMQSQNYIEAVIKDVPGGSLAVRERVRVFVQIPPERAPSGTNSIQKPQLQATYQDPNLESGVVGGLHFDLFAGSPTSINVGSGHFAFTGADWIAGTGLTSPSYEGPVRVGAVVQNNTTAVPGDRFGYVIGFTNSPSFDTLVISTTPGGAPGLPASWLVTDAYRVLRGPDHTGHGRGAHGGSYQAVVASDPTLSLTQGSGVVTLTLNDMLGEAYDHFQIGQYVMFANNCCAVLLKDVALSAPLNLGEEITVSVGVSLGTKARVRALQYTGVGVLWNIVVDVIRGPSGAASPYKTALFTGGDVFTATAAGGAVGGVASGATGTLSGAAGGIVSSADRGSVGWFGRLRIVDKRVHPTAGRRETQLDVDTNAAYVNPSLDLFPSFCIGQRPKTRTSFILAPTDGAFSPAATSCNVAPGNPTATAAIQEMTPNNATEWHHESLTQATISSLREPDVELSRLPAGEIGFALTGMASALNAGQFAHIRGCTTRSVAPTLRDEMPEDGDARRDWLVMGTISAVDVGQGFTGTPWWIFLGPGATP